MARTIRRKNAKYSKSWHCETEGKFNIMRQHIADEAVEPGKYKYVVNWYQRWTFHKDTYKEYLAANTAHFHAEKRSGYYTPPSDYVNWACNRPLRRKLKQQLHHALINDNFDDVVFEPYIKDAGWYFF